MLPEAILGGLADYADDPTLFAIVTNRIELALAPLASDTVTTIVGLTELTDTGLLYNSAAVLHRGAVLGVYRKLHPAINRSVYAPGRDTPVFSVSGLTFGVIICNDSNFREPASRMAGRGATVLFVPTNTALPLSRASADLIVRTREVDAARASENGMWVVRADVAGRTAALASCGSSAIVDPHGCLSRSANELNEDSPIVEIYVLLGGGPRCRWPALKGCYVPMRAHGQRSGTETRIHATSDRDGSAVPVRVVLQDGAARK